MKKKTDKSNFNNSDSAMAGKILGYYKSLAFLCGCFSISALPPYYCFPLLFATFGLLLALLFRSQSARQSFAIGYWFGFGFYACGFFWVNNALMLDLPRLGWLIPLSFLGSGAFFGLFVAFPACFSHWHKNIYAKILSFAAWWVIFEWIRSFLFTGFPWNLLGSVLAFDDTGIQAASLIGTYGLSLLVLLLVCLPVTVFFDKRSRAITINLICLPILAALIWGFGFWRLSAIGEEKASATAVRLVQPSIPQQIKWKKETLEENLQKYIALSRQDMLPGTKLVIWGETANTFSPTLQPEYLEELAKAVPGGGYLITGSLDYTYNDRLGEWNPLNAMIAIDENKNLAAGYIKSHLVPFGEYIPFRKWLPDNLRTVTNFIADFGSGNGVETIELPGVPPFGVLICYEVIFPAEVADRSNRPQWLINLTNDGWYGLSAGPYQHLVAARLRATEEGLTMVRVANSGISAVISKTGKVMNRLMLRQSGTLDVYLPQELSIDTIYGKFHNYITIILCLIVLGSSFLISKKTR